MDAQELVVKAPDMSTVGPPTYANVVHVSYTPYDFRVTFSLLSTPHDSHEADPLAPTFAPRAVAEVVLPAAAVESMVDLLKLQLHQFVDKFGAPSPGLSLSRP